MSQPEIPNEILNEAMITKKGIYTEVYDINSNEDYEGDIEQTEIKYLNSIGKIHRILIGVISGGIPVTSIESIKDISQENNESVIKLAKMIDDKKTSIEPEQLKSFIDNYFFRYAWWLGGTKLD